ncbi:MAG: hypothetical protein EXS59_01835 [Candidatus Taylorbacteria bacterium]|nr:hypothetical protein [Candidatus Taylorbacteria bacterium]
MTNQNKNRKSPPAKVGDELTKINAAQVRLNHTSAVWFLVETKDGKSAHVSVFSDEIHISVIVDVDWLRASAAEEDGEEAKVLAAVLDAEPLCQGWRKVDVLYIHPQ